MAGKRKEPLQGYVSITDITDKLQEKGLNVRPASLKYRFDHGEIPGIRDLADPRKRRLIEASAVPEILMYYEKISKVKSEKRSLCCLAEELGIKKGTLYGLAERKGIPTAKWGNFKALTKYEYSLWKEELKEEMEEEKEIQKNYFTTGYLAKEFGTSHYMVIYWIKQRKIPARKIGYQYFIAREDYAKHGKDWKSAIESEKAERDRKKAEYITKNELAEKWGTSTDAIAYKIKKGKIPTVNVDKKNLILRAEFEKHGEEWRKECRYA